MPKLSNDDWKLINKFLFKTEKSLDIQTYCQNILREIKNIILYDHAIFFPINKFNKLEKPISININEKIIEDYFKYYQFIDEFRIREFNRPYPTRSTDIINYKKINETEYFNDFLKANQFYYLCGVDIHYNEELIGNITLIRSKTKFNFTKKDLLSLELLRPHIANHLYSLLKLKAEKEINLDVVQSIIDKNLVTYNFTPREIEVFYLVLKGFTNKKIAKELSISVSTVKKHLNKLFIKANVKNKRNLILKLIEL